MDAPSAVLPLARCVAESEAGLSSPPAGVVFAFRASANEKPLARCVAESGVELSSPPADGYQARRLDSKSQLVFRIGISLVVGEDTNNGRWLGITLVGGENAIQRHLGLVFRWSLVRTPTTAAGLILRWLAARTPSNGISDWYFVGCW